MEVITIDSQAFKELMAKINTIAKLVIIIFEVAKTSKMET
jgi:hypothetical protein